jgi:hypothetical protein
VAGGGFGDIWRGEVGSHAIAIKAMRIFDASGVDKILKVRIFIRFLHMV